MSDRFDARRLALLLMCLFIAGCGSHVSDKEALERYFEKTGLGPDAGLTYDPGPIRSVQCHATEMTYRSADVYVCDLSYEQGDLAECGARVNGKVVMNGLPRCIP
jgi:hypothetical protein